MKEKNRRRRYWINASFQRRFLILIVTLEFNVLAAAALLPIGLTYVLMNPKFNTMPVWEVFSALIGVVVLTVGFLVFLTIRFSHRICGAAYRIQKSLEALGRGENPGAIHLREGDEFQELADAFNKAFQSVLGKESSQSPHDISYPSPASPVLREAVGE